MIRSRLSKLLHYFEYLGVAHLGTDTNRSSSNYEFGPTHTNARSSPKPQVGNSLSFRHRSAMERQELRQIGALSSQLRQRVPFRALLISYFRYRDVTSQRIGLAVPLGDTD